MDRRRHRRRMLGGGAFAGVTLFARRALPGRRRRRRRRRFKAKDVHSARRAHLADYKGQVVLLNVWATWCEPCKDEMPSIEELYKAYGRGAEARRREHRRRRQRGFDSRVREEVRPHLRDPARSDARDRARVSDDGLSRDLRHRSRRESSPEVDLGRRLEAPANRALVRELLGDATPPRTAATAA